MTPPDLSFLPSLLQATARVDGGEVCWPLHDAPAVIRATAAAGLTVLGLDAREYNTDGSFFEWPLSAYQPARGAGKPRLAAQAAIAALDRVTPETNWILITWERSAPTGAHIRDDGRGPTT